MAIAMMSWMFAIPLLGLATGLRSMTPMAVLCWFAYSGNLPLDENWDQWAMKFWVAVLFSALALGEIVADKMPFIPDRIALFPLLWRILLGGLVGAMCGDALNGSDLEGIVLGVAGALLGAFAGYMIRRDLVQRLRVPDWQYALAEDIFTIACTCFALQIIVS